MTDGSSRLLGFSYRVGRLVGRGGLGALKGTGGCGWCGKGQGEGPEPSVLDPACYRPLGPLRALHCSHHLRAQKGW